MGGEAGLGFSFSSSLSPESPYPFFLPSFCFGSRFCTPFLLRFWCSLHSQCTQPMVLFLLFSSADLWVVCLVECDGCCMLFFFACAPCFYFFSIPKWVWHKQKRKKASWQSYPYPIHPRGPPFPRTLPLRLTDNWAKRAANVKKNEHNGKWQTDEAEVGGRNKRKRNTNNAYARSVVVVCQPVSQQESSWRKGKGWQTDGRSLLSARLLVRSLFGVCFASLASPSAPHSLTSHANMVMSNRILCAFTLSTISKQKAIGDEQPQ